MYYSVHLFLDSQTQTSNELHCLDVCKYLEKVLVFITLDQRFGANLKTHVLLNFAQIVLLFLLFTAFWCENIEKLDFNQLLECTKLKHWSKYTTFYVRWLMGCEVNRILIA